MNAPATAAMLAKPALQAIDVSALVPSKSHVQELRRGRFTKESLQQLADDFKRNGMLQHPLVRPLASGKYEIVAGERRWLAAKLAGMAEIFANVKALSDDQALEAQLAENLEREKLHELEEAEGYEELMKLKKLKPDDLVGYFGGAKSRSTIYARLKLLALCPEARKAFYAGELDASRALLIARIGHHDTQRQALKDVQQGTDSWEKRPMTYREAHKHILETYMLKLSTATFDIKDATLVAKAGDCIKCPKRTGNQADLFGDVKSADVCTDPKCFDDKRAAHLAAEIRRLKAAGKPVIEGNEAKAIFPSKYNDDHVAGGYVALDAQCYDDPKRRTMRQILGVDAAAIEHVVNPHKSIIVPVVRSTAVTEALNARGMKTERQKMAASRKKQSAERTDSDELLASIEEAQLLAVFKTAPARFGKAELLLLLAHLRQDYDWECDDLLTLAVDGKRDLTKAQTDKLLAGASEEKLAKALVAAIVMQNVKHYLDTEARRMAKGYKVDLAAIEKKARTEFKAKTAKKTPAPKAKAATKGNGKKK